MHVCCFCLINIKDTDVYIMDLYFVALQIESRKRLRERHGYKMKFVCLAGAEAEKETLTSEFKAAKRMGEIRMGEAHLFYRYFIRIKYVSYEEITRAYMREESGESGEFLLKEHYLMLKMQDGVLHKLRMEREEYVRETLHCFEKEYSHILVGFDRLSQSK